MPFRLSCAPDEFQKRNLECFSDIEDVLVYFDDLLIETIDEYKHDLVIEKVLQRARQLNIKFNSNKIKYKQREIKYVGMNINNDCIVRE